MTALTAGVLAWALIHLMPALAPALRTNLVARLGENSYRGLFALAIVVSVVLMVVGWRSAPLSVVYVPPVQAGYLGFVLTIVAFVLIGAAHYPTRIKRVLRHPMLCGIALWAASHLLQSGTTRALVLFGGLGIWALIEIPLINRRDGAYKKPEPPAIGRELRGLMISGVIVAAVLLAHPYIAGVSPFPR